MSKEFLARILTVQNSLTTQGSQDCPICQEKCGTLSPETGIMELEVRLPCNHTVGSAVSQTSHNFALYTMLILEIIVHCKLARQ